MIMIHEIPDGSSSRERAEYHMLHRGSGDDAIRVRAFIICAVGATLNGVVTTSEVSA